MLTSFTRSYFEVFIEPAMHWNSTSNDTIGYNVSSCNISGGNVSGGDTNEAATDTRLYLNVVGHGIVVPCICCVGQ